MDWRRRTSDSSRSERRHPTNDHETEAIEGTEAQHRAAGRKLIEYARARGWIGYHSLSVFMSVVGGHGKRTVMPRIVHIDLSGLVVWRIPHYAYVLYWPDSRLHLSVGGARSVPVAGPVYHTIRRARDAVAALAAAITSRRA